MGICGSSPPAGDLEAENKDLKAENQKLNAEIANLKAALAKANTSATVDQVKVNVQQSGRPPATPAKDASTSSDDDGDGGGGDPDGAKAPTPAPKALESKQASKEACTPDASQISICMRVESQSPVLAGAQGPDPRWSPSMLFSTARRLKVTATKASIAQIIP